MENLTNCPACSANNSHNYLEIKDHSVSGEVFKTMQCGNCSLIYTNPRPEAEALGPYYESEDYISHTNNTRTLFEKAYHIVRSYMLKQKWKAIAKHQHKTNSLLDIGAGTGAFLNHVQHKVELIQGVEPSDKARKIAEKQLGIKLSSSLDAVVNKDFDCITLWHVLEHLPELRSDLNKINQLLKDEGLLIIAVPNSQSYDAKNYQEFWAAYDVPRHLYHFTKESLDKLIQSYNFEKVETRNMPFDSFYVSLLSAKYQKSSKLKAILTAAISNLKGLNSKNQSSLIHIYRKKAK